MTINKICGSGPKAAHGTKLLPEDAMVREALLDPLAQDPFAFSIGNRDGRKISLGFYSQVPSPAPSREIPGRRGLSTIHAILLVHRNDCLHNLRLVASSRVPRVR
jgi:hypothetical protein